MDIITVGGIVFFSFLIGICVGFHVGCILYARAIKKHTGLDVYTIIDIVNKRK